MDVSPKTLREVEFREKMRGYHPEDVDQFLERVAAGIEVLQDRLRQAIERAQRAEQAANEAGGADDALRRTLLLAQRTADLAVSEGREQAARIIAVAEQQAQAMISEAELRARQGHEDTVVGVRAEVTKLEARRQQLQADIEGLARWAEAQRHQLRVALEAALTTVGHIDLATPAPEPGGQDQRPSVTPEPVGVDQPTAAHAPEPVEMAPPTHLAPPAPAAMQAPPLADGPPTIAWQPDEQDDAGREGADSDPYFAELRRAISDQDPLGPRTPVPPTATTSGPAGGQAGGAAGGTEPPSDELCTPDFVEARRFGGRLRRRF